MLVAFAADERAGSQGKAKQGMASMLDQVHQPRLRVAAAAPIYDKAAGMSN